MLSVAEYLARHHEVDVFWNDTHILEKAQEKFTFDLRKIHITPNIFSPKFTFLQKLSETKKYDTIIYLSDGSLPLTRTKKLIIHFQFPVEWVNNTFLNKIKFARTYKVFCNSKFTKQYIDKKFDTDSLVIYPPIDEPLFTHQPKENIILTVGRYGYLPNGENFKKHD